MTRGAATHRWMTVAVVVLGMTPGVAAAQVTGGADEVDVILTRAWALRRDNRKSDALEEIARAVSIAPDRVDVRDLRQLLDWEVHGWEVMAAGDFVAWEDGRSAWKEAQLSLRKNTELGPVIVRGSHAMRAGLDDDKIEVEVYPAFRSGYAALGVSIASDVTLYPRSILSAELFKSLTSQIEASAGYRRFQVAGGLDLLTGSVGLYYGDFLLGARGYHVLHDGTSGLFSARRYLSDDGQYVGALVAVGSMPAVVRSATDFDLQSSWWVGAETMLVFESRWVLRAQATVGREEWPPGEHTLFTSGSLGLGLRF